MSETWVDVFVLFQSLFNNNFASNIELVGDKSLTDPDFTW